MKPEKDYTLWLTGRRLSLRNEQARGISNIGDKVWKIAFTYFAFNLKTFCFPSRASADSKKILEKYRVLVMRNHPDRGGSPYLTKKINEAKEMLLKGKGEK